MKTKTSKSINPTTEQIFGLYTLMDEVGVEASIEQASHVQFAWARTELKTRKRLLLKLAKNLLAEKSLYANTMTHEMGKPISEAIAEIEKCAALCAFYAKEGPRFLKPESIKTQWYKSYRSFHPLGIIFAIMPWNFPFWQVMRFAVPNLMAGNAGILKHAPNCFGSSLLIEELFIKSGFPKGLFASLLIDIESVPFVIEHPKIAAITLTGSNSAGRAVAKMAGAALKKVVLELGGSDPYIILKDADLEFAAEQCVASRLKNCGQVCIAAKRLIVVNEVKDAFEQLVIAKARAYKYGDPLDENTLMGPMAREDLRANLHRQVLKSIEQGARCVLGGKIPEGPGYFYPTTVLLDVKPDALPFREELFGPVICITTAEDEEHALSLANQSDFGLAGAIFTKNIVKGEYLANHMLQAGTCGVNTLISTDPRLPFGGIKQSGYGRELSVEGIREFVNIKTLIVSRGRPNES
ncbi:MAG: NAD-dependent succinate-semialdehyde dehydrogenase [Legionella sp.]|nr:NAD-dependent succinate-semialdehyde dehydrogenase [Legionella sp.]